MYILLGIKEGMLFKFKEKSFRRKYMCVFQNNEGNEVE